jgi:hypothetical protein
MANVFIEESTMQAIGDAIREKTGKTDAILPADMPAEIGGISSGDSCYDTFWDTLQNKGGARNYYWAFNYGNWNDKNYNPKYPIVGTALSSSLQNTFYYSGITATKVDIDASNTTSVAGIFYYASSLKTVKKLNLGTKVTGARVAFGGCDSLENITIEGTIQCDWDMSYSPRLTPESMKSVISCLENYAGTSSEYTKTVSFTDECWAALEADSTAPDGGTWEEYVAALGWNT